MLAHLAIQDFILIERLAINFNAGLNILTGETGAGKSMVLDALGLCLGARSDASWIRQGANQAIISATFIVDKEHPIHAVLQESGLPDDDEINFRRIIHLDGKSKAYVNDQPIGVGLLKQLGQLLLEVLGQFEAHGLLDATTHINLLDAFGGLTKEAQALAKKFHDWQECRNLYHKLQQDLASQNTELDFLRFALNELEQLSPADSEYPELVKQKELQQHSARLSEAAGLALEALDADNGARTRVTQAHKNLLRQADKAAGAFDECLALLDSADGLLAEASEKIHSILRTTKDSPKAREALEERLYLWKNLARKHNQPPEALTAFKVTLAQRVDKIENADSSLKEHEQQTKDLEAKFLAAAKTLSASRRKAAQLLQNAVAQELPSLKLEQAQFAVQFMQKPEAQFNSNGLEQVIFVASTNQGIAAQPLAKIASGGELARFMLALRVVMAKTTPMTTIMFDEVDGSVGGGTASAIGRKLKALSENTQVLAITHSPQVAVYADQHWHISKLANKKQTQSDITLLNTAARREELARMLSTGTVTPAALAAADQMLADATAVKPKALKAKS